MFQQVCFWAKIILLEQCVWLAFFFGLSGWVERSDGHNEGFSSCCLFVFQALLPASIYSLSILQFSIAFRNKVWTEQSSWENGLVFPFEGPGLRKLLCSKVSYVQVKLFSLSSFSTRTQTDYWSHKQTKEEGKSLTTMVGCGVQRPSKWFVSILKQPFFGFVS